MTTICETCYTSCGCNRTPHSADWGRNGLICFASCNAVAIYNPEICEEGGRITDTLFGHTERVNCVRWLKNNTEFPENELVSASSDGTAIIWSWNNLHQNYSQEVVLKGHSNTITIADGLIRIPQNSKYIPNESPLLVATASIDSTVMVWERCGSPEVKRVDVIHWNSGFCLDLKFTILPHTDLAMLACAADDNKVHLFAERKISEVDSVDPEHKFYKIHVITGHEDWVRAMDFMVDERRNLYLATGSQDTFIRVHKFEKKTKMTSEVPPVKDFLEQEEKIIKVGANNEHHFSLTLETILAGHEGWVYGLNWHPPVYKAVNGTPGGEHMETTGVLKHQKLKLLSSSMDKTMIIWAPDETGLWSEEARVGEVGGNMLGFYGGKFGPEGHQILAHGYQGSFHIWSFAEKTRNWEPKVVVSGHTSEVTDLCWDIKGNFILSVGGDQTTRLHAPWVRDNGTKITWHEIARPQIHGYDINCLAMLSEYKFASGAEEKVIRAFTAPNNFVENFRTICDVKIDSNDFKDEETLPQGASVPALGLSNKPVFEQLKKEGFIVDDEYPDLYFSPIYLKKPPTEENLMQNTLWPEAQKLYGHGYEVYSLASRKDGVVLASSCKAATPEHAAIILWNAKTWLQIQKLIAHQLTVTQMSFSPNGKYLLSVSRDRRWCLFGVKEDGKLYEQLAASNPKENIHTRVLWCCSWTFDSNNFATGSRDGKIGIWEPQNTDTKNENVSVKLLTKVELGKESVTALAFAPVLNRNHHILAVGLENGSILLYRYLDSVIQSSEIVISGDLGLSLTVKRLAFRPKLGRTGVRDENQKNVLQLACCGSDHVIKIYDLYWNNL